MQTKYRCTQTSVGISDKTDYNMQCSRNTGAKDNAAVLPERGDTESAACRGARERQQTEHVVDAWQGRMLCLLTFPPIFFRLASSWSMMPTLVVRIIFPNCKYAPHSEQHSTRMQLRHPPALKWLMVTMHSITNPQDLSCKLVISAHVMQS